MFAIHANTENVFFFLEWKNMHCGVRSKVSFRCVVGGGKYIFKKNLREKVRKKVTTVKDVHSLRQKRG